MKRLRIAVHPDGDIELVFVSIGPFSLGLRLDRVPNWVANYLRPQA